MKTNLHYVFLISFFLLTISIYSQQNYWTESNLKNGIQGTTLKNLNENHYKTFSLDYAKFKEQLTGAPIRGDFSGKSNAIISFPNTNGKLEKFRIIEAPVLSEELSARYPNIKTYLGLSIDNPGTRIRFSVTPLGVNAMTSFTDEASSFLVPSAKISNGEYLVYTREANLNMEKSFECLTEDFSVNNIESGNASRDANDQLLRTFRIAISTTGEYTNFWDDGNPGNGNAQEDALAQVVSTINRINEVFEVDMAVNFSLVTGTEIIYPDATLDPYTTNLTSELQSTLTSVVTEANYDIGHLFHKVNNVSSNNGNAGCIGCVCVDGQKGSGFSAHVFTNNNGGPYMTDFFDIDYVAHEIGHQMGARHTWSFQSEGSGVQTEPGSGSTIMGYAGITGPDDVQDHSDSYFHYNSINQILNNLNVRTCWTSTAITNNPPVANAGIDYTIPKGTAFILKGAATDTDGGDVLSYTWEQINNGVTTSANFGPTKASGPTWRSRPPNPSPNRYMPILSRVLAGQLTETNPAESVNNSTWETVSTVGRNLNFALTVRDRSEINGVGQMPQSSFDTMAVTVDANSGPFAITSQTTNEDWAIGSTQIVTWDVANTHVVPVNTTNVNILLSIDGGLTFPFTLASNVPNDGSQSVIIPNSTTTTQARVIVEAVGNIFYAVSSVNFNIIEVEFLLQTTNSTLTICKPDNAVYNFTYNAFGGFSETSVFSANNVPAGAIVTFNPTSASVDGTAVTMTISNTGILPPGFYAFSAVGTAPSETNATDLTMNVFDSSINTTNLNSPSNDAENVSISTSFEWSSDVNVVDYLFEIATDSGFTNIIESATIQTNSFSTSMLAASTQYYWRVTGLNQCGTAGASNVFNFTTENIICDSLISSDTPINIPDNNTTGITSIITVPYLNKVTVLDVNVTLNVTHPWIGDLTISLTSPKGTTVNLVNTRIDEGDNYTNTVFDDDATNTIASSSAPYTGTFRPVGNLSNFNLENSNGQWKLKIVDGGPEDIGTLDGWSLNICGNPPLNFSLPSNNFRLLLTSETCRSSNNGSVAITAVEALNYTAQLSGNGVNSSNPFTNSTSFNNLAAGSYTVCITVENQPAYQQCFNAVITEPEDLSVLSRVDTTTGKLNLQLSGGINYTIDLNGTITYTNENEISLSLSQGINQLRVTTDKYCQGEYKETINNSSKMIVFPNPIVNENYLKIYSGGAAIEKIDVVIYSLLGKVLLATTLESNNGIANLDVSRIATGIYLLVVKNGIEQANFKVLKQ